MAKIKAKVIVPTLHGIDALQAVMSPAQVEALDNMAGLILDHDMQRDAFTEQCDAYVKQVWAKPTDWATWKPTIRAFRDLSEYAAKCLRDSYKRVHGDLPTANDKRAKGGSKGSSPKKWANGFESRLGRLTESLTKMPKSVRSGINAAALKRIADDIARLTRNIEAIQEDLAA